MHWLLEPALAIIYTVYYYIQRIFLPKARELPALLDDRIPFVPGWVWIYSGLYYVMFLLLIATIDGVAHFSSVILSFVSLAAVHMAIFMAFPVKTPLRWREYDVALSRSTRFLAFIQKTDAPSNSMPSLHVGAATLIALHLADHFSGHGEILKIVNAGVKMHHG